jgi:uncharacterized MnhB-related membrane protein
VNEATILLVLLPIVSGYALLQKRRLHAIVAMSVFSLLLSAVYLVEAAPDVAITEAAIGAALITFVYVLAIRRTGRLTVAASEVPGLLTREGDAITGLEWEILRAAAHNLGVDAFVRFVSHAEATALVESGEVDVAAGGLLQPPPDADLRSRMTESYLPTARFTVRGPAPVNPSGPPKPFDGYFSDVVDAVRQRKPLDVSLDLARFLSLMRHGLEGYEVTREPDELEYSFAVSARRPAVHRELERVIDRLRKSGELEALARRYLT